MARLWRRVRQLVSLGAGLALAGFAASPVQASIVPSIVPPNADAPAPAAPPSAGSAPAMPGSGGGSSPATAAPSSAAPPPGWSVAPDDHPAPQAGAAPAAGADGEIVLDRPEIPDTARLATPTRTIVLDGVTGLGGTYASNLYGAIVADGGRVACRLQGSGAYRCALADGTDVAALALRNGAAQARPDASGRYQELEALARDERRGLWADLPPPPVRLEHPTVIDTATLTAGGRVYPIAGLSGLGAEYARQLQSYIQARGDWLLCSAQGGEGTYACLLPDQSDLARVALVNGAARVAPDAPDSYRADQGEALAGRRGYWRHSSAGSAAMARARPNAGGARQPGDGGGAGVRYIGDTPAAVVDGETVFLVHGGPAGWGYWDRARRWHRAPAPVAQYLERSHPGGAGLRLYRPGAPGMANDSSASPVQSLGGPPLSR